MKIQELQSCYSRLPQAKALVKKLQECDGSKPPLVLDGLHASSAPLLFASIAAQCGRTVLFVLNDADEAGYFYHDLTQLMGDADVLFFPSSFRRAIKYAQKDAPSEILRTEVLTRLQSLGSTPASDLYIVTHPEALAEMVIRKEQLDGSMLTIGQGQTVRVSQLTEQLRECGFREVDYVYEPGQFALRGSILDVFSFSHEYPYRIDFFGDEVDSIRTFEVEDQLSRERCERADIVAELSRADKKESLFKFLPRQSVLVFRNYRFVRDVVERTYQEGFSKQAMTERLEGATEMERRELEQAMNRESNIMTAT